ncbi:unnamed protein product, partial [Cylicocyclus nassatus]
MCLKFTTFRSKLKSLTCHSSRSQSPSCLQDEDVKEESTQCESVSVREVLKEHGRASNTAMSIKIKKDEEIRKSESERERRK